MKKIIELVRWLYKGLIHLYPSQYLNEFGDELSSVFDCMMNDSAQKGPFALLKTCLRELWDLPGSIAWAHIRSLRGGRYMKTWVNSQPVQFSLRSGAGIGVSFLAINVFTLLGQPLIDFSTVDSLRVSMVTFIVALAILFALVFGFAMAFAFKNLHAAKYFFLLGLAWSIWPQIFSQWFPNLWEQLYSFGLTNVGVYAINGALLGACLNPWRSDSRKFFQFALAGGVGLPLARALVKPIFVLMGISSSQLPIFNIVSVITNSLYWAVVGLLLGAFIGMLVHWIRARNDLAAAA
jgi:hypothetical protein